MIVRYGFYEGTVEPGREAEFDACFRDEVVPGLARMPGVVSVRLLRDLRPAGIPQRFHHIIELTFRDMDGLVQAMNSPERRSLQHVHRGVMPFFDGATPHGNFEVTASVAGEPG
jgi:antibiotic biosynthesis monooxygenase (ABM) superfamily enzyme